MGNFELVAAAVVVVVVCSPLFLRISIGEIESGSKKSCKVVLFVLFQFPLFSFFSFSSSSLSSRSCLLLLWNCKTGLLFLSFFLFLLFFLFASRGLLLDLLERTLTASGFHFGLLESWFLMTPRRGNLCHYSLLVLQVGFHVKAEEMTLLLLLPLEFAFSQWLTSTVRWPSLRSSRPSSTSRIPTMRPLGRPWPTSRSDSLEIPPFHSFITGLTFAHFSLSSFFCQLALAGLGLLSPVQQIATVQERKLASTKSPPFQDLGGFSTLNISL